MKLQINGNTYQLTIPAPIVRAKGWDKGDDIQALIDNKGDIVLKRKG